MKIYWSHGKNGVLHLRCFVSLKTSASENQNYPRSLTRVCHCRTESWCCTWRIAFIFTFLTPLLQICCFFLQVYQPTSPLVLVIRTSSQTLLKATQRTAWELTFLNSYFNQTAPDLGPLKENSLPGFPQALQFLLNHRLQSTSRSYKTLSFWPIYYLARSSSLQFYPVLYFVLCFSTEVFCLLLSEHL